MNRFRLVCIELLRSMRDTLAHCEELYSSLQNFIDTELDEATRQDPEVVTLRLWCEDNLRNVLNVRERIQMEIAIINNRMWERP